MPDPTTATAAPTAPPLPLVRHHREGGDELREKVAEALFQKRHPDLLLRWQGPQTQQWWRDMADVAISVVAQAQRPTRIEHALLRGGEDEWEMRQPRVYVKRQDEDLDEFIESAGAVWWDAFALVSREVGPWTVITPPRVAPLISEVPR